MSMSRLSALVVALAFTLPAFAAILPSAGARAQSQNVAIIGDEASINGGALTHADAAFNAFAFAQLPATSVSAATLAPFDTVVLNVASSSMSCTTSSLSASAKSDLVAFVAAGGKMIIYDSECAIGGSVDYSWLPFPFTTSNPGATGSLGGSLTIMEDDSMGCSAPASACFLDTSALPSGTDGVGDSNVVVTQDMHWCGHLKGQNVNGVVGYNHMYARSGAGLYIYNGMDMDFHQDPPSGTTGGNQLARVWLLELLQPFGPDNLTCSQRVACEGTALPFPIGFERPALSFDYVGDTPVAQVPPLPVPRVFGPLTILATASDLTKIATVDFYVDGSLRASVHAPPFQMLWDPESEPTPEGTHTLHLQSTPATLDACPTSATRQVLVPSFSQDARSIALFAGNALPESGDVVSDGARATGSTQHDNRTVTDQERASPTPTRARFANDTADTTRAGATQHAHAESVVARVDLPDLGIHVENLHAIADASLTRGSLVGTHDASAEFGQVRINGDDHPIAAPSDITIPNGHVRFGEVIRDVSLGHEEITVNAMHVYFDGGLARDEIILGQAHAAVDLMRGSFSGVPREIDPQNDAQTGGDASNDFAHATPAPIAADDGQGDATSALAGRLGGSDTADYYSIFAAPGQTLSATLIPAEAGHVNVRRVHADPVDGEAGVAPDLSLLRIALLEPGSGASRASSALPTLSQPDRQELNVDVAGAWVVVVYHTGGAVVNYTLDVATTKLVLLPDDQVTGPDAGSTCADARVAPAEAIAGVLHETDPADVWSIHATIGDTITAALKSGEDADGANFDLYLYDSSCALLASSTLGVGLVPKGAPDAVTLTGARYSGTYFVEVRRVNGIGNYELETRATTTIPSTPLADGVSGADAPDSASCSAGNALPASAGVYSGFLADGDAQDAYTFETLRPGQRVSVTVAVEPGVSARVELFGPGCALLASGNAGLAPASFTPIAPGTGPFTLVVTPIVSGGGYLVTLGSAG